MAIKIKFDLAGNPEPPTILLANRSGNILGQLQVDERSIDLSDRLNDISEFSFTLNKYVDEEITNLWDKVVDFKLVYCKEWDTYFEIKVEIDEATETIKTVFCKQLGQAELSQILLYNVEINTEDDIARDDYKISILYDSIDPKASILNRLLDKAPHYSVAHVDDTIAKIQRSFSFDGTSIHDALQEVAEEIGCLFIFNSNSAEGGKVQRTISVYDLQQYCYDCGHRGEYTDKCPKCGSTNIKHGYGEDTLIFVTSDELASSGIQLVTDTDSVKNCFKLEAGDDDMTAAIRNCNPNGTDYIWYFSDAVKEDMSDELVDKIESYDVLYNQYYSDYESELNTTLLNGYNGLINKYSAYNEDLQTITSPIKGYASLMNAYYNVIDLALYLKSGLMPSIEMSKTSASEQVKLLTSSALSPVAVKDINIVSLATANSAVLTMAKVVVKSTYKVQVNSSELIDNNGTKIWRGNFTVTNYSDEEDTAISNVISVNVNDDEESFVKQKIDKALNQEKSEDYSITGLFEKEYDDFCNELKKYALKPLESFHDAGETCIDVLIENGVTDSDADSDLYEKLYTPYYNKLMAIEAEMKVREDEINIVAGVYDLDKKLVTEGLQSNIEKCKNQIQKVLNFEDYLGNELWLEFCAYRREDKYSNENYISDGLSNSELFQRAFEFYDVARNEIYKSSELQHSISTTLNNLLVMPKFKHLVDSFEVGNWIRVFVNDYVYKLRLLEYDINFGDLSTISVEFSDVTKIKDGITDVADVVKQASSIITSYDTIQKQAGQGNEAKNAVDDWIADGLNSALVQIQNNNTEEITLTKNGLLGRSYDDITETYSPEQIKLTHNILCFTDDNWKTVRQAIGKHKYRAYSSSADEFVPQMGYGMTADFVTAGVVSGSQIIGGDIYSDNYSVADRTGSYMNLRDGTFSFGGGSLRFERDSSGKGTLLINSPDILTSDKITEINEEYIRTTSVYAENLQVGSANIKGKLTAEQIDVENLEVDIANVTGQIQFSQLDTTTQGKINDAQNANQVTSIIRSEIDGMSLSVSNGSTSSTLKLMSGSTELSSQNITFNGFVTFAGLSGGTTTIDGACIKTGIIDASRINTDELYVKAANVTGDLTAKNVYGGTIEASIFKGAELDLYGALNIYQSDTSTIPSGVLGYVTGSTSSGPTSGIGIRVNDANGNQDGGMVVATNGGARITYVKESEIGGEVSVYESGASISGEFILHNGTIVSNSSAIDSSDASIKTDINYDLDAYEVIFDNLKPVTYKYKNGTSGRDHTGFIAGDVKDAIEVSSLSTQNMAAYCEFDFANEDTVKEFGSCGLRYEEFVALNTWQIQKLKKRLAILEQKLSVLENEFI